MSPALYLLGIATLLAASGANGVRIKENVKLTDDSNPSILDEDLGSCFFQPGLQFQYCNEDQPHDWRCETAPLTNHVCDLQMNRSACLNVPSKTRGAGCAVNFNTGVCTISTKVTGNCQWSPESPTVRKVLQDFYVSTNGSSLLTKCFSFFLSPSYFQELGGCKAPGGTIPPFVIVTGLE
jgi:hypothetical protein